MIYIKAFINATYKAYIILFKKRLFEACRLKLFIARGMSGSLLRLNHLKFYDTEKEEGYDRGENDCGRISGMDQRQIR